MTHICGRRAEDTPDGGTPLTRSALFGRAAVVGGGAVTTGAAAALASGASPAVMARDVRILNYVLRLEELKAAFYQRAAAGAGLTGELQQLAELLARHERAHVAFLRRRLGNDATEQRTYDFGDTTRDPDAFASTARTLEETAVAAYVGQGANLSRRLMTPFAQLCSVEARHAAWIADVLEQDPAPNAADTARRPAEVIAAIEQLGFEVTG
jgi:rubrerythrin